MEADLTLDKDELIYLLEGGELVIGDEKTGLRITLRMEEHEFRNNDLDERYKTCGRCVHDGEGDPKINGSYCYLCKRNPIEDNRIDFFEELKEDTDGGKENSSC